jgi:hypothetical protein
MVDEKVKTVVSMLRGNGLCTDFNDEALLSVLREGSDIDEGRFESPWTIMWALEKCYGMHADSRQEKQRCLERSIKDKVLSFSEFHECPGDQLVSRLNGSVAFVALRALKRTSRTLC